jgi:hypothetical protein
MKKTRVYTITGIALGILGFCLLTHLILYNFFDVELIQLQIIGLSLIVLSLSRFFGLTTEDDFFKNLRGHIIDDKETINWYLNKSFFLICILIQLIFALSPEMASKMIGGNFNYLLTSLLPTFVFILRSFVKKNTINERELIKLNRRDRIRTSDLTELNNKVDLAKWISNDYVLQVDRELFSKLVLVNVELLKFADSSLLKDKEFLLRLLKINYRVNSQIDFKLFEEGDFDEDIVLNIIHQFYSERRLHHKNNDETKVDVDFAVFTLMVSPIPIDTIITRIIEIYQTSDSTEDRISVFSFYNHLRDEISANRLTKYKLCENQKHVLLKTDSKCFYCTNNICEHGHIFQKDELECPYCKALK